jgi:hypothetical protein
MWRPRAGHIEYLTLREPSFALAGRALARFTYRDPFWHGSEVDSQINSPMNAFLWLLDRSPARTDGTDELGTTRSRGRDVPPSG